MLGVTEQYDAADLPLARTLAQLDRNSLDVDILTSGEDSNSRENLADNVALRRRRSSLWKSIPTLNRGSEVYGKRLSPLEFCFGRCQALVRHQGCVGEL